MTDATATPAKTKPQPIFMIGGGQKEVTQDDLKHRTFTIRVNVECKTDEREVTAVVPIYEHVLLEARYMPLGGEARITADWLPSQARYPRVVPLSMDNLRDEVKRLEATYRIHLPNGNVRSLFKEVFGRDGDPIRGFYRVLNEQVRAWRALERRVLAGHKLQADDMLKISHIAKPEASEIAPAEVSDFSDGLVDSDGTLPIKGPDEEGVIGDDPLADLMEHLGAQGWDAEVIMDLCKALGDGDKVTQVRVNELPSIHGKKALGTKLMADYRVWLKKAEEKAKAETARAAESTLVTAPVGG